MTSSPYPLKGSWIETARDYKIEADVLLSTYLCDSHGNWHYGEYIVDLNRNYINFNGILREADGFRPFEIYVINLDRSSDRMQIIDSAFRSLNCDYIRVKGIDGKTMDSDTQIAEEFFTDYLSGVLQVESIEDGNKWTFDKTVPSSGFFHLFRNGHHGAKGLILSNLRAMKMGAANVGKDWIVICEDDCNITQNMLDTINSAVYSDEDIVWLDQRGKGGACCVMYRRKILDELIKDLHPLSEFSKNCDFSNLWDWKLFRYEKTGKFRFRYIPCVQSGKFKSTIDE